MVLKIQNYLTKTRKEFEKFISLKRKIFPESRK